MKLHVRRASLAALNAKMAYRLLYHVAHLIK
jgi:hypothetical protein